MLNNWPWKSCLMFAVQMVRMNKKNVNNFRLLLDFILFVLEGGDESDWEDISDLRSDTSDEGTDGEEDIQANDDEMVKETRRRINQYCQHIRTFLIFGV